MICPHCGARSAWRYDCSSCLRSFGFERFRADSERATAEFKAVDTAMRHVEQQHIEQHPPPVTVYPPFDYERNLELAERGLTLAAWALAVAAVAMAAAVYANWGS